MPKQLRMRVFAGPNGSGKSTVINAVRKHDAKNGVKIDFGYYINADDIAAILRKQAFLFEKYAVYTTEEDFKSIALSSGLINHEFTEPTFKGSFSLNNNQLILINPQSVERLAQVIADFLRKKLLIAKQRFSFETVFSHESKLAIMQQAVEAGYKVYLYFVSTESPEINKYRVELRTKKGGHFVPPDKIENRYFRSLELLYKACQLSYQVFFFDNSQENTPFKMFAHFKKIGDAKKWDELPINAIPEWFKIYYSGKILK